MKYGARLSWKFDKHIHTEILHEAFRSNIENISWWGEFTITWFSFTSKKYYREFVTINNESQNVISASFV